MEFKKKNIGHYWKTIVAGTGGAVLIGNQIADSVSTNYGDGVWDTQDTVTTVVTVLTVFGVWWKQNGPKFKPVAEDHPVG